MATVLEAFVRLFADDAELRKSFGALPGVARQAGDAAGLAFSEGLNRSITQQAVTPGRATGARPLQLPRVGGREVNLSSPFSKGFQQFKQARELADIQGGGGLGDALDNLGRTGNAAKETGEQFHGARTAARLFGTTIASEVNPGFGEFVSASVHGAQSMGAFGAALGATLAVAAIYITRLKEATDFQIKFAQAQASGDPAKAEASFKESKASLDKLQQLQKEAAAGPGAVGGPPPFQAFFANLQLLFGAGVKDLQKRAREGAGLVAKTFAESTVPKQGLEAEASRLRLLTQTLGIERQAAESADALRASTEKLAAARRDSGEVEAKKIELERLPIIKELAESLGKVGDDAKAAAEVEAVAKGKLADVDRRAADVRKGAAADIAQIRRDGIRDAAAAAAAEIDATEKIRATVDQRRDAIVGALSALIEIEAQTNLSLKQAFIARQAIQVEETKNALESLQKETDAKRAAARERLADSPIALERELTQLTEQETTKRQQIELKAATDRIQLARRTQQELLAQTEQIFSIQRTLGQRSQQDDLARFASTAAAAQAGSKTQLDALAKVAASSKALADQAKQFLGEALAASDQLAQSQGKDLSEFVSLNQLATDAAAEQARLEAAQRTLSIGGEIKREDFQALQGGALERLRAGAEAGRGVTAADLARMSVDSGQGLGAFQAGLDGAGGLGTRQSVFGAQLGEAFSEPADIFRRSVPGMTDALEGLVSSGEQAFQDLETVAVASFRRIEAEARRTGSVVGESLVQRAKDSIARDLDRDLKLY